MIKLIGLGRHNKCKYAELSLNMNKGKYAICRSKYAEICTKYAVPKMQEIYTNMHMQMKNMQYVCKISNMHKYEFICRYMCYMLEYA